MTSSSNSYGQKIGHALPNWTARPTPPETPITGQYCRVEKLTEAHAAALFSAYAESPDDCSWTYLPVGPFADLADFTAQVQKAVTTTDPLHHAIIDLKSNQPVGSAALMRIDTANGVMEIGFVAYSPRLKHTCAGTEAMFLLMRRAFDELGYRRYEWKCDNLNEPSLRAAKRYGFQFEGIFRQAVVYKGRSRDTAWFSIIDSDWPLIRAAFEQWLSPGNFDENAIQRRSLEEIRSSIQA